MRPLPHASSWRGALSTGTTLPYFYSSTTQNRDTSFYYSSILNMETTRPSQTSLNFYHIARCHISEKIVFIVTVVRIWNLMTKLTLVSTRQSNYEEQSERGM
jgi:hypothetical protein